MASSHYTESDSHVIRRFESFSDIVIGFSLAEAAYNLVIPAHPLDLLLQPVPLSAFLNTFVLVAILWWSNSLLFQYFYVPGRVTVILGFAMLALTVLLVFSLQMWMHVVNTSDSYSGAQLYFGALALTYLVLGVLFVRGLVAYRSVLPFAIQARGMTRCFYLCSIGLGAGLGTWISAIPQWSLHEHGIRARLEIGSELGFVPFEPFLGFMLGWALSLIFGFFMWLRVRRANAEV